MPCVSDVTGDRATVTPGTSMAADRTDQPPGANTDAVLQGSGLQDSEEEPELLVDLSLQNREYRPFRSEDQREHVNSHLDETRMRTRSSDSTSSQLDPSVVKMKVKRNLKKQQQKQHSRRLRKSGEASIATQIRRDNSCDIRESLSAEWY